MSSWSVIIIPQFCAASGQSRPQRPFSPRRQAFHSLDTHIQNGRNLGIGQAINMAHHHRLPLAAGVDVLESGAPLDEARGIGKVREDDEDLLLELGAGDYTFRYSSDALLHRAAQFSVFDADTPMGAHARDLYAQFVENEDGAGRDFSAMLPRPSSRSTSAKSTWLSPAAPTLSGKLQA